MRIENRLAERGLTLPAPMKMPSGLSVADWLRVVGMVNTAPGFTRTPAVINGFSDLILDLWGPEAGPHARSATGVAELPFGIRVEIEAEVAFVS